MGKIKITGDSTIDLSPALLQSYQVETLPLYINMENSSLQDGVSISPEDIYRFVAEKKVLPKTSAPSVSDYMIFFRRLREECSEVIHFNISSEFSSAHQNAKIAAEEIDGVTVIDSRNLSTGTGLLVLEACEAAETAESAQEVVNQVLPLIPKVEASFIIERLDYLAKGGRCSSLLALGANILKLRPMILVADGKMEVGKKFRGSYDDCMTSYIEYKLKDREDILKKRIFITHTKISDKTLKQAHNTVEQLQGFDEILETTAGCTITTHCGEGTLGVLFIRK